MKKLYSFVTVFLFLGLNIGNIYCQLTGQVSLDPRNVPQFIDPLPHFAGNRVDATGGNLVIKYVPVEGQVAVSTGTKLASGIVGQTPGIGRARFWGYSISNDGENFTAPNWPSYTIVAQKGIPVKIEYINELTGETYESVNLIADQTLHWAAPTGMEHETMMMPYEGPIPVSPHLHGGEVASESDGGPDSWFTPAFEYMGSSWQNGVDNEYDYPNTQEAATLWYHDHALGVTRLNVYAGLAGFYFLKGPDEEAAHLPGWSGDDLVEEVVPTGKSGVFNPVPYLPEIEIAFQDRMFDTYGQLYYPNLPPNLMEHPYWTPEFVGNIITVNGKTWPYLSVAPRKYRFRLLNGSNARFYEIWLQDLASGATGPQIIQIGTDGGLLDKPVPIVGKLLLAPGERADVVIDFSASRPGQTWTLRNTANAPFPKGEPPNGSTTGRLMQFVVNGRMISQIDKVSPGSDKSLLPASLRSGPLIQLTDFAGLVNGTPAIIRQLTLNEVMGMGGPMEVLVNNTKWDGNGILDGLGETELPVEGTTEIWQIINLTADAHPIHLHLVQFQLVSRQKFNLQNYNNTYNAAFPDGDYEPSEGPPLPYNEVNNDSALGGNPAVTPFLQGPVKSALLNERGWKDTYIVYPGDVTTFVIRFAPTNLPLTAPAKELMFAFDPGEGPGYVWHCHIIDHEDNEMMRPYHVLPSPERSSSLSVKSAGVKEDPSQVTELNNSASLEQNYPNPFSGETIIQFRLPESSHVKLVLFDQMGQLVEVLIDGEAPEGVNTVKLNSDNLKPGIYFYQLNTGKFTGLKKIIVTN